MFVGVFLLINDINCGWPHREVVLICLTGRKMNLYTLKISWIGITTVASNVIRTINEDDNGNLWIGIENGGLSLYNIQNKTFDNYLKDEIDNASLSNNSIWSSFQR